MAVHEIIDLLKEKADAGYLAGMQRYGIDNTHAIGVRLPDLRKLAKIIKKNTSWRLIFGRQACMRPAYWHP
jgi:3-methyladenine DNA glycosylase AlkD